MEVLYPERSLSPKQTDRWSLYSEPLKVVILRPCTWWITSPGCSCPLRVYSVPLWTKFNYLRMRLECLSGGNLINLLYRNVSFLSLWCFNSRDKKKIPTSGQGSGEIWRQKSGSFHWAASSSVKNLPADLGASTSSSSGGGLLWENTSNAQQCNSSVSSRTDGGSHSSIQLLLVPTNKIIYHVTMWVTWN